MHCLRLQHQTGRDTAAGNAWFGTPLLTKALHLHLHNCTSSPCPATGSSCSVLSRVIPRCFSVSPVSRLQPATPTPGCRLAFCFHRYRVMHLLPLKCMFLKHVQLLKQSGLLFVPIFSSSFCAILCMSSAQQQVHIYFQIVDYRLYSNLSRP